MVMVIWLGKLYCVEIGNGCSVVCLGIYKVGKGGDVGLWLYELFESVLVVCVCMLVELVVECVGVMLLVCMVDVIFECCDVEIGFDIVLCFVVLLL